MVTRIAIAKEYVRNLLDPSVIKNFFIYSFSSLLLRGLSLITAPITLTILNPADYGLLALANSFISITTVFLGLGLRQAFSLEFFHKSIDEQKSMITDIIVLYLIVAVPVFVLLLYGYRSINNIIFVGQASTALIVVSLVVCLVYFFVELFYQILQLQSKAFQLATIQGCVALITIVLNIFFLWYLRLGVYSVIAAQLVGMVLVCITAWYNFYQKKCPQFFNIKRSLNLSKQYLKLGLPLVPSVLFAWILSCGDRWVLARLGTMDDVGIYSLAEQFGQLFHLLVLYPMSCSYLPYLLREYKKHENNLITIEMWNHKIMRITLLSCSALVIIGYLIAKPVLFYVLPIKFQAATNYILFIVLGNVLLLGVYFANGLIQFYKKSFFLGFVLIIPALLNIGLNFLLIPHLAIYGCVIATLIAYGIYFGITLWYNRRLINKSPTISFTQD